MGKKESSTFLGMYHSICVTSALKSIYTVSNLPLWFVDPPPVCQVKISLKKFLLPASPPANFTIMTDAQQSLTIFL